MTIREKNKARQTVLNDWLGGHPINQQKTVANLPNYGDAMTDRFQGDEILRIALHNKRANLGDGKEVTEDVVMIKQLGIDIQGYCECNKPWTTGNKAKFE